jgi:hypothetical protein
MKMLPLLAVLLAAAAPAQAQHAGHDMPARPAATAWTTLPLVQARPQGPGGAEVRLTNSAALDVTMTSPKGDSVSVLTEAGKAKIKPDTGNYHLLTAVEACDTHVATAATAVYFSNPGPAPTALLKRAQTGLTVLPERLPREHGAYRAGETWRFRVAFDGTPFPGAKVRLETSNGSRAELVSGIDGSVEVHFPEDFPPRDQRPPERHGQPDQAQFVVAAISQTGATQHIGAFNYVYRPNAYDGSSLWTGAGFAALGMICAVPLLRRRAKGDRR